MCLYGTVMLQITVIWTHTSRLKRNSLKTVESKKRDREDEQRKFEEWAVVPFCLLPHSNPSVLTPCAFLYRNVTEEILHLEAEQAKWKAFSWQSTKWILKEPHAHLHCHTLGQANELFKRIRLNWQTRTYWNEKIKSHIMGEDEKS